MAWNGNELPMRCRLIALFMLLSSLPLLAISAIKAPSNWLIFNGEHLDFHASKRYNPVIFSVDKHPNLKALKESNTTLFARISLHSVNTQADWFPTAEKHNLLLENTHTNDDVYWINIDDSIWRKQIIENIIPSILRKGFDGIVIESLDDIAVDTSKTLTAKNLVKTIRYHYTSMPIILMGKSKIVSHLASDVNGVIVESSFNKNNNQLKDAITHVKHAQRLNPKLRVYSLDFWDKNDNEGLRHIYHTQRRNGFMPYVATPSLTEIIREPNAHN